MFFCRGVKGCTYAMTAKAFAKVIDRNSVAKQIVDEITAEMF